MRIFMLSLGLTLGFEAGAEDLVAPILTEKTLLGTSLKVEQHSEALGSGLGVITRTNTEFLDHSGTLVEASVEAIPSASDPGGAAPSSTPSGKTDFYIAGTRIWTSDLHFEKGSLVYVGGVAPLEIPIPLFVAPIGPFTIRLDAGVDLEGDVNAVLTPGLSYPLVDSSLDAKVEAQIAAAGYLEGYANIWLIRGGVGGRVNLIDGHVGVLGHLYLSAPTKPVGEAVGLVRMLNGSVYGFIDSRFFFGRWRRILKKDFFKWSGQCFSFGAEQCTPQ